MEAAGIPHTPLLAYHLFTSPAMRLLRGYLDLIVDPEGFTGERFRFIINRPNRYVKNVVVEGIAAAARPWQTLLHLSGEEGGIKGRAELRQKVTALRTGLDDGSLLATLVDDLVRAFALEGYWNDET